MNVTPAMAQYYELKEQNEDSILFFRMGDFYEMFGEDALIANKVLGIAVTSRNKNAKEPIPLAGIPFHAKEKYLPQLISAGYKVAIAEQVSDPKLKGIVQREVVRVVTPATLGLESEGYEVENSNIIAISCENDCFGMSVLNMNSNLWSASEFSSFTELQSELFKVSPKEVILDKKLYNNTELQEVLNKKYGLNIYFYQPQENPYKNLTKHLGTKNLVGFGLDDTSHAVTAANLLLEYLQANQKENFSYLNTISYKNYNSGLQLDESTIKNLDLVYNFATKSQTEGTLFGILNKTKTKLGKDLLYKSILEPLGNIEEIQKRQSFVKEFLEDVVLLDVTRSQLTQIANIQGIMNRIALNRMTPKDMVQLKKSLISIVEIIDLINKEGSNKLKKLVQL